MRTSLNALQSLSAFFYLRHGRLGDRLERSLERFFAVVSFKFTSFVDELLALCARVGLLSFGFYHRIGLADLQPRCEVGLACREVRHG